MVTPFKYPTRSLLILLCFYGVVLLIGLGSWGVIETSEARYAEISREMAQSGDWMHPRLLGIQHYHKPPVTYWITAIGYKIFGVNAFGARFFLTISFLVQMFLVYKIASIVFQDCKTGLIAAVVYSSIPIALTAVRGLTTDAYLTTAILGSITCWFYWRTTARLGWLYLVAFCLGLAFLIKGPVALLVPCLVFIALNGVFFPEKNKASIHHALATLLFILVAFSWFALLVLEDARFVDYFFFRHTVERLTQAKVFVRTQPFWYYLAFAPLFALPWVVPFFKALFAKSTGSMPIILKRISWAWIIIPLFFFSLSSSKLVLYILPLYSGFTLLLVHWIRHYTLEKLSTYAIIGMLLLLPAGLLLLPFFDSSLSIPLWQRMALLVSSLAAILWFNKLQWSAMENLLAHAVLFFVVLISASVMFLHHNELKVNSLAPLSVWIKEHNLDKRSCLVYNRLLPSLSFHLQKEIISIHNDNRNVDREIQFEKNDTWKDHLYYIDKPEDEERLKTVLTKPCILIFHKKSKPGQHWILDKFRKQQQMGDWFVAYN